MMKPVKFAHTIKMDFNESEQNTFKHRSANVQNSEMINPDVMKFFYSPRHPNMRQAYRSLRYLLDQILHEF